MRKNSSCGLEVLKNAAAASVDFLILFRMLPLMSNSNPMDSGASSKENLVMGCSTPSSKTLKSALRKSVMGVPNTLVTCAGTSTSAVSTRMSALGKMVWPVETDGRRRGKMEAAVSTPDAWNAQQGEHARNATARHAGYLRVRAIGRLYITWRHPAQLPIHGVVLVGLPG